MLTKAGFVTSYLAFNYQQLMKCLSILRWVHDGPRQTLGSEVVRHRAWDFELSTREQTSSGSVANTAPSTNHLRELSPCSTEKIM